MKNLLILHFIFSTAFYFGQTGRILLFASHENTYYSELIVAKRAFEAAGYTVDVMSANTQDVSTYMLPTGTTIEETSNTLAGSSHAAFVSHFSDQFGVNWNNSDNSTPAFYPVNGSILSLTNLSNYDAFVLAGGTGILDYRLDGTYSSQGTGNREISAATVEQVALKLNELALEALSAGKPILAQCHGASLPVFWRIPNTQGTGAESLGISLLKGENASGYPDANTQAAYASLQVNYIDGSPLSISSPNPAFSAHEIGKSKILTSRDWYPQTVAFASRALLSILQTYPTFQAIQTTKKVLIIHGGAVDETNCSPSNRLNDIPCNYGLGNNLPADYTDILALLNSNSNQDNYLFDVDDIMLTADLLPFNQYDEQSVRDYIDQYDVLLFFKHWSTGITLELQNALKSYIEDGGGMLSLHHALYHDIDGILNKNVLVNDLYLAESAMNTWSANLTSYSVYPTNTGHFISSYGMYYPQLTSRPTIWNNNALLSGSNSSQSLFQSFSVFDEIYNNFSFSNAALFGRNTNEITPLFSNDLTPNNQTHTTGFCRTYNQNNDDLSGRLVYFEIGERKENFQLNQPYAQLVRNALVWGSKTVNQSTKLDKNQYQEIYLYPNPTENELILKLTHSNEKSISIISAEGKTIQTIQNSSNQTIINTAILESGIYFLEIISQNEKTRLKFIKK